VTEQVLTVLKRHTSRAQPPTERVLAGKIYLSPIIDCFDGLVVSWSLGTSPDAEFVNTMFDTDPSCIPIAAPTIDGRADYLELMVQA